MPLIGLHTDEGGEMAHDLDSLWRSDARGCDRGWFWKITNKLVHETFVKTLW